MFVGPRLALSWLTVLPVRGPHHIGRAESGKAIASAPLVGTLLGAITALILWAAVSVSLPGMLAGVIAVAALALLTRGMHIDGLADTADGLGCYGPPERAREVMQSGSAGPFGVAAIVLTLGIQSAGFGALADAGQWWSVVVAVCAGRVAVVAACRRGVPAASDKGFGALVASTQSGVVVAIWTVVALAGAAVAVPDRWWQGPIVVAVALTGVVIAVRHCVRRFGGLSGDVLGAAVETTTACTVVGLLLGAN